MMPTSDLVVREGVLWPDIVVLLPELLVVLGLDEVSVLVELLHVLVGLALLRESLD